MNTTILLGLVLCAGAAMAVPAPQPVQTVEVEPAAQAAGDAPAAVGDQESLEGSESRYYGGGGHRHNWGYGGGYGGGGYGGGGYGGGYGGGFGGGDWNSGYGGHGGYGGYHGGGHHGGHHGGGYGYYGR